MTAKPVPASSPKMALVVHSDMGKLSSYQAALTDKEFVTIIARDLPTALLAITQHYFDIAIVSSRLAEGGDGWPLAGVLHLVFPKAFVAVVAPEQPDILALQSAINNGVREIYDLASPATEVIASIVAQLSRAAARPSSKARVQ